MAYSKSVIYIITTGDDTYIGSTRNYDKRKMKHKSVIYSLLDRHSNSLLYRTIRKHNGIWNIEIYKKFPCNNKLELRMEEQNVINELNSTLNQQKAYRTKAEEEVYQKEYREQNKEILYTTANEKLTCECGCKSTKRNIARHRKSRTHINFMNNKKIDIKKYNSNIYI